MKTLKFKDYQEFSNREDKTINGVIEQFANDNPEFEEENETNKGCWNCSNCSGCRNCSNLSEKEGNKNELIIPIIENIHQKILEATSADGALDMSEWHTCDNTHCRAGWVVFLAGKEGKDLENKTSTEFAASQIYKKSSNIRVLIDKFYLKNKESMEDIKRCAEEESKIN
jgi:hypothetical protein